MHRLGLPTCTVSLERPEWPQSEKVWGSLVAKAYLEVALQAKARDSIYTHPPRLGAGICSGLSIPALVLGSASPIAMGRRHTYL